MKSIYLAALIILVAGNAVALIDAELSTWYTRPSGDLKFNRATTNPGQLDLRDDLAYRDRSFGYGGYLALGRRHQFMFDFSALESSSSVNAPASINFPGLRIGKGARMRTEIEMRSFGTAYRYKLGNDVVSAGLSLGLQYRHYDVAIKSGSVGRESSSGTLVPTVGAFVAAHPLPLMNIKASVTHGRFNIGSGDSAVVDFQVAALMNIPPVFHLGIGYRALAVDYEGSDIDLNLKARGPMASIGMRF